MGSFESTIKENAFFAGIDDSHLKIIADCCSSEDFKEGAVIAKEGQDADLFFIVQSGKLAIDIPCAECAPVTIQTVTEGGVVGWSWLIPPNQWRFNIRAVSDTQALVFDGKKLKEHCGQDTSLGYALLSKFATILANRLEATRLQFIDAHGRAAV